MIDWYQIYSPTLLSTQIYAKELIDTTTSYSYFAVSCAKQTAGYGKRTRIWYSPKGNLYMTLALRNHAVKESIVPQLCYLTAVAIGNTLVEMNSQLTLQYKWVNDVLVEQKKVAGILLEKYKEFTLIGIGVNISSYPNLDTAIKATSLKEQGIKITPKSLFNKIILHFSYLFEQWLQYGFLVCRDLWLQRAYKFQEDIKIQAGEAFIGKFIDIDNEGILILELKDKRLKRIFAGDMFVL